LPVSKATIIAASLTPEYFSRVLHELGRRLVRIDSATCTSKMQRLASYRRAEAARLAGPAAAGTTAAIRMTSRG
jgi:hypothetical protein